MPFKFFSFPLVKKKMMKNEKKRGKINIRKKRRKKKKKNKRLIQLIPFNLWSISIGLEF